MITGEEVRRYAQQHDLPLVEAKRRLELDAAKLHYDLAIMDVADEPTRRTLEALREMIALRCS